MALTNLTAIDPPVQKKQSPIATIGIVAVLSLLGLGGGWFVGKTLLVPAPAVTAAPAEQAPAAEPAAEPAAGEHGAAPAGGEHGAAGAAAASLITLPPIVTNLGYPTDSWIRLELALQFSGPGDDAIAQELHQEILGYLRTVSLQQVQGPRGFQYLRDDLREIVDLRSKGRVSKVLFRTFVIE
ncbi:flagellar basal body-associated FliL family protein [Agrobacterium larrymoorei]|uniref:flagellar basal body-associated FliL family protein n=1 Tax=Agrobacterium larrymoorei TaxID=160699 RepID=UPI0015726067|nr:flagellar basal body-associated FliL family protein [Agrobacterium larrymoorei]NTJ41382.1 flagellar basal body-associated FliL family protein [Agrobacterium larrymoorei]